jgi:ATP-binding cassette subfamily B protein/subfamily B ATP-binding cassette protein MsbA
MRVGGKLPNPQAKRREYLSQYVHWLWPHRGALLVAFLLSLATTGLELLWPLALWMVINNVLAKAKGTASDYHQLHLLGLAILGLLFFKQVFDTLRSYRLTLLNAKLVYGLRTRLLDSLLKLPMSDLAEMKGGGIVSRLSSDVDATSGMVRQALIDPLVALVRVILTVAILAYLSWRLAASALILLPPLIPLTFIWLRRVRPLYRSAQAQRAVVDGRVIETFGGVRVVRAFRREKREQAAFAESHHRILRTILHAARLELLLEAGWGLLQPAAILLVVWYGGLLVLRHQASIADLFVFQIYAMLLLPPVFQIILAFSQTQKSLASMERVFDVFAMPVDKPDVPGALAAPAAVEEIRLENVCFAYRAGLPVLRDISLQIPAGATVALVGPSGAGKSTLADLVARFHDPTSGQVFLNGIDLRTLKLAGFRSLLSIVPQDVFLFDGSIGQNIAYGRRGATEGQIIEAARRANAHGFIMELPEGYHTIVGERGFKLSGGQKQRLSIARAILAEAQILILDEATSNLDSESEQLIQASLADLLRHPTHGQAPRTTFIIAHRLSTIAQADMIVVVHQGKIIETGTHDSLLAAGGMYAEMVERQRNGAVTLDAALP